MTNETTSYPVGIVISYHSLIPLDGTRDPTQILIAGYVCNLMAFFEMLGRDLSLVSELLYNNIIFYLKLYRK